jgi:alpha-1,6-mannosyltransferase
MGIVIGLPSTGHHPETPAGCANDRMDSKTRSLLICDLTQSYASRGGGGVSTFLAEKRRHVLERTDHRLMQIVPGPEDRVVEDGRHIWVEIGAQQVRGSPNYRFILRRKAVREVLERYRPDLIESQCPWVLPWVAIRHRRAHPETALVAGYHTDFPNAHVHRVANDLFGPTTARMLRRISLGYGERTYREFDRVYTLSEATRATIARMKIDRIDRIELGTDTNVFDSARRDPLFRQRLGLPGEGPLLIYTGRLDNEKRADRLVALMRALPGELGAALVLVGDGKLRARLEEEARGLPIAFTGYLSEPHEVARALASSDIYVSAMADETFGLSVIEAQACGLPVVGVASGAMIERVPEGLGLLGPVDDIEAMARNVVRIWYSDRRGIAIAARSRVALRYGWRQTFDRLFEEIYPHALGRAAARGSKAGTRNRKGFRWPAAVAQEHLLT